MKKSTFTLILFFSSVILYAQQNELMFHSLGSQHGLTYSAVRDILQDSKGYIWIATLQWRIDKYSIRQRISVVDVTFLVPEKLIPDNTKIIQ